MTPRPVSPVGRGLTLAAALLGWMFDGMEMGLFPLVARPALGELLGSAPGEQAVADWYAVILAAFLVGAAAGGVVFGWLGDRVGRVRAMTLSVLLYSVSNGLSAAAQEAWQLGALRFIGALGMGGEWALGVALVMEVWPNTSRAWLAGWIGAFGNLGYTLCGSIAYGLNRAGNLSDHLTGVGVPAGWATALTAHENWRLLMLFGAAPALLTLLIRLFVPESDKWSHERDTGKVRYWSGRDLLGVLVGVAAAGGLIVLWSADRFPGGRPWPKDYDWPVRLVGSAACLAVVTLGFLYPAWGYLRRAALPDEVRRRTLGRMLLGAGLSGVPLLGTWAAVMWMYAWVGTLPGGTDKDARPLMQISSSVGAAVGCLVGAGLAGVWGRRPMYAVLCVLSFGTVWAFYHLNTAYGPAFVGAAGLMGLVTAAFYGWLPLYLPELFPTAVRATGQGFGFNYGRILAAVGNLQMASLLTAFDGDYPRAATVMASVYGFGLVLIVFAPETRGRELPA